MVAQYPSEGTAGVDRLERAMAGAFKTVRRVHVKLVAVFTLMQKKMESPASSERN